MIAKLQKPLSIESKVASERLAAIGLTAGKVGRDIRNLLQVITGM
jgi:hypothetical protein